MTQMSSTNQSLTPSELDDSLDLIEIKADVYFSRKVLLDLLPDVETALFFGAVYQLDYKQLSNLLSEVLNKTDVIRELFSGAHSTDLQDYLVDELDIPSSVRKGDIEFSKRVQPKGEILPQLWASLEIEVAQSIMDVANKLKDVVGLLPGKKGSMVFNSMMKLNLRRPTLGVYRANVHHPPVKDNLLILDVSGSVTAETVRALVDEVVALSYMANAHMAIVSNTATHWDPGTYGSADILRDAEYGGTRYEQLRPLFDRDWGVVITIADYDSAQSAKTALSKCVGRIDQVVDISLVDRPTFLAECVGQMAAEVRPILIGNSHAPLGSNRYW